LPMKLIGASGKSRQKSINSRIRTGSDNGITTRSVDLDVLDIHHLAMADSAQDSVIASVSALASECRLGAGNFRRW